jgi:hypothetical protein
MKLKQIHGFLDFLTSLKQARYFDPTEKDEAINFAQSQKYNEEKVLFNESAEIRNRLRAFEAKEVYGTTANEYALASGFDMHLSVEDNMGYEIEEVAPEVWASRLKSRTRPPDEDYPVFTIRVNKLLVRPSTILPTLYYLRVPKKVESVFSTSANGRDIFMNESSSTDLEWPDSAVQDIVLRTLTILGVPLKDETMLQFEKFQKQ